MHHYLVGEDEGRAVLDAARAARAFAPKKVSKRVVIAGHSQGGHAALFAAALAPGWTPELRVRGTVAFAPASHLATQFQATLAIDTPGGGLGAIVGLGIRAADLVEPALERRRAAHAPGHAALPADRHRLLRRPLEACVDRRPAAQPAPARRRGPRPAAGRGRRNDPERLKIGTPVRIEQGDDDGTVFKSFTDQLVADYEQRGVDVTYKSYPGVSHGGIVDSGAKDASAFIRARLK